MVLKLGREVASRNRSHVYDADLWLNAISWYSSTVTREHEYGQEKAQRHCGDISGLCRRDFDPCQPVRILADKTKNRCDCRSYWLWCRLGPDRTQFDQARTPR